MQSLIERAMVNEDSDVEALRELAVAQTVEGDEPSPRIMCDGGVPRPTAGWRSPLGGPRYEGPQNHEDPRADEWREAQIEREIRIRQEAEAVAGVDPKGSSDEDGKDDGLRADGSGTATLRDGEHRDDDNTHARRNAAQREIADQYFDELPDLGVGDHVRDRDGDDATMLVVGTPIEQADAYEFGDDGQTVADANDCPADDDVLEVVFPSWTDVSTRPLDRYAYPRSRLERVAAVHDDGDDTNE